MSGVLIVCAKLDSVFNVMNGRVNNSVLENPEKSLINDGAFAFLSIFKWLFGESFEAVLALVGHEIGRVSKQGDVMSGNVEMVVKFANLPLILVISICSNTV